MYFRLVRTSRLAFCNPGNAIFHINPGNIDSSKIAIGTTTHRSNREAIMSVPIRSEDGIDNPLSYSPRRARHSRSVAPEHFAAPLTTSTYGAAPRIAKATPMAPGIGGHNIDLPRSMSRPFEGDVAIKDLRRRLSLDPQLDPEPPIQRARKPVLRWLGWLPFVAIVAAIIVFGAALVNLDEARNLAIGVAMAPREGLPRAGTLARPARLIVENQKGFANEPLPLGVSLNDASGGETVFLAGFAAGTEVSAGSPLGLTRWRVSAHDLGTAFAYSPRGFVGVMDVAIDLRSVDDRLLDSQVVRLNWIEKKEQRSTPESNAKPLAVIQLDPATITSLEQFRKNGDIMSARLLLKRAAIAGNAQAALELGMTFDPIILSEQGVVGFAPDVAEARGWYERAVGLGSTEASGRLDRLAHIGR
jgi:hypothetical protein